MRMTKQQIIEDYVIINGEDSIINVMELSKTIGVSESYLYKTLTKLNVATPRESKLRDKKKKLKDVSVKTVVSNMGLSKRHIYNFNHKHKLNKYIEIQPERTLRYNMIRILLSMPCLSYVEIAKLMSCSTAVVFNVNSMYKVRGKYTRTNFKHAVPIKMLKAGICYNKISEVTGYSVQNIRAIEKKII